MERIAEEIGNFENLELVVCTSSMQSSKFISFSRIRNALEVRLIIILYSSIIALYRRNDMTEVIF